MKRILLIICIGFFVSISYAQNSAKNKEDIFTGIKNIVVDSDFCTLKMIGHDGDDVIFNGTIKTEENIDNYDFKLEKIQDTLRVNIVKPENWNSHWGELTLKLPHGISVESLSQSGKVEAENLKELSLTVKSKSGNVALNNVEGKAWIETATGNLNVTNFTGDLTSLTKTGSVNVKTLKGNCDISCNRGIMIISDVQGKLIVEGGTGNMELDKVEGDVTLKSNSGNTKISGTTGNIVHKSFNGDIKLFNTMGVYDIQTSVGQIVGTRVALTASSSFTSTEGNIKIQLDTKSDLSFTLKSTNSFLRAMNTSKKKSLKIGKGEIVITGTSTTGSQAFY